MQPLPTLRQPVARRSFVRGDVALLLGLGAVKLLLHLFANRNYGYHRDEFYYIVGGARLAWGYVDHPPLTPLLAIGAHRLFGDGLLLFRLLPALAGAAVVVLAGVMAWQLGGGRYAQALAALAVITAPLYLVSGVLFQTVPFDQLWWVLCTVLLIQIIRTDDQRLWLGIGFVAGLGLLTKHTILLYGFALVVGLLLTPLRRSFRTPWLWIGGAIAASMYVPHLAWQAANGRPTLEFIQNNNAAYQAESSRFLFVAMQFVLSNPLALPLLIAGLYWVFGAAGKPYRILGWMIAVVFGTLLLLNGKEYYGGPLYPVLFALGAVALERLTQYRLRLRQGLVALVIIGGLIPLPAVLPVLPRAVYAQSFYGVLNDEFYEMFGWPELVASVAATYRALPPADQATATILTANYGEAGALDFYGDAYGLPPARSAHNSYYFWGPGTYDGVFIVVGYRQQFVEQFWNEVEVAGTITNKEGLENEEYGRSIFVCRGLRVPIAELWAKLKHFE